ncbi:PRTRC system protein B [Crenobacter sp. SG2305]|uniref:PRTRC system protein B n=1 Tax=Crenobacter oryzisoli TaxID=3056844 RepID=UPI0025AAA66A|nr:PRTRC system protein B [Crenobacter sp. SG2305]MDN0082348.1 PRTRC system protein B [Crenobacter sp. SG2305]
MKVAVHTGSSAARACASIVLYGSDVKSLEFAMIHPIVGEHGKEKLGSGQPLTMEGLSLALTGLAKAQAGHQQTDFLPGNVLSTSPVHIAWWRKPGFRTVFFRVGGEEYSFSAPHPGLIMVASGRDLRIGAVQGVERPNPETPVFEAPYFNVWKGGRMCVGNVSLPGATIAARIAAWEDAFFNSWFTHPNGTGSVKHPGDMSGLWQMLREQQGQVTDFPEQALVPMGISAQQFVSKLGGA